MNQILYENRCRCNEKVYEKDKRKSINREDISEKEKKKSINRSEGKPFPYPKSSEITSKTFRIKYEKKLSPIGIAILNSFRNKYIYYAIDDILYLLKEDLTERNNLLALLYSPVLSLQNNLSINFFDIWIRDVYIEKEKKVNKFIASSYQNAQHSYYITIKLFYKTRIPAKKQESLW